MSVNYCPQCGAEVRTGAQYCSSCGDRVGADELAEPLPPKERPLWRWSELKRILESERFRLAGLTLFVVLAVATFIPVVRNRGTISQVETFIVAFVGSWLFFYLDLRHEYDDSAQVVAWALFGFFLFIVAVPLYTSWRLARKVIGSSQDATPYFKASVGLAFVPVLLVPVVGMVPRGGTIAGVIGFLFLLALVLSGLAMFLDLNTDRHWTRALVWPLGAVVVFYVVLPYYFYKRRRSFCSGEEPDSEASA